MDATNKNVTSINLVSLVNSHENPFVVIDRNYCIVAVNKAYENKYGISNERVAGRKCYEVSHNKSRPCDEEGEECPHLNVFESESATVCTHLHLDAEQNMQRVRVSAYPLKGDDGELYLGESIDVMSATDTKGCGGAPMVGESQAFLACIDQLTIASSSDAPVLLQGETGTGKELAAEYIHQRSARNLKPFQIVDSTVLTENLFESEMFGHVRGAFTGSTGEKQGLFELADGGTIFLDEVGELPLSQQAKLLRVLESGQYRRVGGKRTRKVNVRIICATNRHLWENVISGQFREDLYYRIACLNIRLPGLRERIEDVPVLARTLLEGINRTMRDSYRLVGDAVGALKLYTYPGNVRELRNILFIAATHSHNREIDGALIKKIIGNLPHCPDTVAELERELTTALTETTPVVARPTNLKDIEKQHINELMERYGGNRKMVADALGVSERTIYRKLKKLGINQAGVSLAT